MIEKRRSHLVQTPQNPTQFLKASLLNAWKERLKKKVLRDWRIFWRLTTRWMFLMTPSPLSINQLRLPTGRRESSPATTDKRVRRLVPAIKNSRKLGICLIIWESTLVRSHSHATYVTEDLRRMEILPSTWSCILQRIGKSTGAKYAAESTLRSSTSQ